MAEVKGGAANGIGINNDDADITNYITEEEKSWLLMIAREHLFFLERLFPQTLERFKALMERHLSAVSKETNSFDAAWVILQPVWRITGLGRCHCPLSCVIRRREWVAQGCRCYICGLSLKMHAPIMKSFD